MVNIISIYDSKTIKGNFANNGLIVLSDCISCNITEELNGMYELDIEYPLDTYGKWEYLLEHNIIKVDGQLFRIYRKIKTLKGTVKINARHIFYDNMDNLLEDVRPMELSGAGALDWILTRTQYKHQFTSTSDVQTVATRYFIRKNVVEAIMGSDGVINTWGGELVRDNFKIELLGARGLDRGVLVAYGKNIQGIEETLDIDGLCTRAMPKGNNELLLPEKYIDSKYINNYPHPIIKIVEFSDIGVDDETGITLEMAETQLREACNQYLLTSKCDIPQFNYKIDFLELSKTEEYKNYAVLERVYLGDTVTIKHSKLNINLKAKVIKITKNILTDRIEKIELGSFKANLATSINNAIQEIKKEVVQVKSDYQKAIDNATQLITGSKGGNVVIRQNEAGKPTEILIMDTDNINTAKNVWRWNLGGFGHSSTGVNGPYDTAITQDGSIVGKFITALEISGEQITAGIIKSKNNKTFINMEDGTFDLAGKIKWDGDKFDINIGEIGGNNLLKNGDFRFGLAGWANWGNCWIRELSNYYERTFLHLVDAGGNDYRGIQQSLIVLPNKTYTLSFKYYCTDTNVEARNVDIGFHFLAIDETLVGQEWKSIALPLNTLGQFTWTFSCYTQKIKLMIGGLTRELFNFNIVDIKLEEGDIATAYSQNSNELKTASFEVTEEHARFTGKDGSYTEFDPTQTGLKWHQSEADGGKDYHYLSYSGTATIQMSSGLWNNTIIQLPNQFKCKQFAVQATLSKFNLPAFHMLANVGVDVWPEDFANGTINIMSSLQCYPVNPVFGSVALLSGKEQSGFFLDSALVPVGAGSVTVRFTVVA